LNAGNCWPRAATTIGVNKNRRRNGDEEKPLSHASHRDFPFLPEIFWSHIDDRGRIAAAARGRKLPMIQIGFGAQVSCGGMIFHHNRT
jgi:hypothetical protein